jgi:hypothetical protein
MKNRAGLLAIGGLMFCLLCFFSCKKKITHKNELIAYVNDEGNGLQKVQQMGEMKIVLTYRPWQMMAMTSTVTAPKNKTLFDHQLFFVLSLSAKNKELLRQLEFNKYSELVQVLTFRMREYIDIIPDEGKPVEPLDCIFQQTYGIGSANNLLMVFNREELLNAQKLKFRIKEFGLQTGDLDFELKTEDIKNILFTALN